MVVFTRDGRKFLDKRLDCVQRDMEGVGGCCISECADGVWIHIGKNEPISSIHQAVIALRRAFDGLQFGLKFNVSYKPDYYTDGKPSGVTISMKLQPGKIDHAAKEPIAQEWIKETAAAV